MRLLQDRKQALENKFAHEAELEFKTDARRNKLLGLWAAKKLAISGDAAEEFAAEYVKTTLSPTPRRCVVDKATQDLMGHVSAAEIHNKLTELTPHARKGVLETTR